MTSTARDIVEPTDPYPPRFRWLKRILLAIALLIGGLFVIRAIAVQRDMRANLRMRSEDFPQPQLADDQNAVVLILKATQTMSTTTQQDAAELVRENLADDQMVAAAESWVQLNGVPLALARKARDLPGISWRSSDSARSPTALHFTFKPLALSLYAAADSAARRGDVLSFAEYERDLLGLARIISRDRLGDGAWISFHGFAVGGIDMDGPRLATARMDAAARDSLSRLIQDLLDDQQIAQWTLQSIAEDRVVMIRGLQHTVIEPETGMHDPYDRAFVFVFRAPLIGKTVRQLRGFDQAAEAARNSTFPADINDDYYLQYLPMEEAIEKRWWSLNKVGTPGGSVSYRQRQIAYRRMYAVALAIRIYQADHDGRFPVTLDELLPHYLEHIPIDPYDKTGKPLQYMTQPNVTVFDADPTTASPGGPRIQRIELLRAPPPTQPSVTGN